MSIILTRIDDRLIHGQVTEGWCSKMRPHFVLVVSDEVDESEWRRELCLASLPCCFEGMVTNVQDSPQVINRLADEERSAYILFESPRDVYSSINGGAHIDRLNVGGMHSSTGKREIIDYIFVDENDAEYLRKLHELGVDLDFRDLPDHDDVDVISRL